MQDQVLTAAPVNEHQPGIAWAWMPTSQAMRHIKTVARGQACGCVCPDCGTPMIAKQGTQIAWHFAHAVSMDCQGESALHRAAKQVLEQAARCHERLPIPLLEGSVDLQDIMGMTHSRSWVLQSSHFDMQDGAQEVRLANGKLIADVMLTDGDGTRLAVEIHVTHQKTVEDAQKYESMVQDAIEIDLSALSWNATETDIHEALLCSASAGGAPRHWVYTRQADLLEAEARSHLAAYIAALQAQWESQMDEAVEPFRNTRQMQNADLKWPTIEVRTPPCQDALGRIQHGVTQVVPFVNRLAGEWQKIAGGWQTAGVTEKWTKVNVCFLLAGMMPPACKRPTLHVYWHPLNYNFILEWAGIDQWCGHLNRCAEYKLARRLDETKELHQFAVWFRGQSEPEQLRYLAGEMKQACRRRPGKPAPAWNASWEVWKTLVWHFRISRGSGKTLNLLEVASDPWLEHLTGWPANRQSEDDRARMLRFWLNQLCSLGVLKRQGFDEYEIASELPADFKPWDWIESPHKPIPASAQEKIPSDIHYRQSPDGGYQLCRGEDVLCSMPEVAICFDASGEQVVLHRHGDPADVQAWVEQRKKELQMKGYQDKAENLTVIKNVERWIPVEELNAMINGAIEGLETAHDQRLPGPR